jgi:hypothetical protein
MVSRMTPGSDDRCPNCCQPEERVIHLNLCTDSLHTRQFRIQRVGGRVAKVDGEHNASGIGILDSEVFAGKGYRVQFVDLPSFAPATTYLSMSSAMRAVAIGQDKIGWVHFLEGKVTGHIRAMQQHYLRHHRARINGQDWI